MSRHVVPAIVVVTLAIMFGSTFLAQVRAAQLRHRGSADTQVARQGHVSAPDLQTGLPR